MNKAILLATAFLSFCRLQAQITITTADMPQVNDSLQVSMTATVGTVDPTLTGTAYTWDFTSLVPVSQTVYHFDNPAGFSLPFNLLFNVFNTSYGLYNYTPDSIPATPIHISKSYDFYKNSSSAYKLIGKGIFINSVPTPTLYSSIDYVFRFPMNYLNVDSCDYKYGTNIPGVGYYGQSGHRVNTVDGWGVLKTPYGTFPALRVKSALKMVDTLYSTTISFGFSLPRPLEIQYKWMTPGSKIPMLEVDGNMVNTTYAVTNVVYRDSARSSVPQLGILERTNAPVLVRTYPNPSNGIVTFDLGGLKGAEINVYDASGRVITRVSVTDALPKLDCSSFNPGMYFFEVKTKDQQVAGRGKISVQK